MRGCSMVNFLDRETTGTLPKPPAFETSLRAKIAGQRNPCANAADPFTEPVPAYDLINGGLLSYWLARGRAKASTNRCSGEALGNCVPWRRSTAYGNSFNVCRR